MEVSSAFLSPNRMTAYSENIAHWLQKFRVPSLYLISLPPSASRVAREEWEDKKAFSKFGEQSVHTTVSKSLISGPKTSSISS